MFPLSLLSSPSSYVSLFAPPVSVCLSLHHIVCCDSSNMHFSYKRPSVLPSTYSSSATQKKEIVSCSKSLVTNYQLTCHHILEDVICVIIITRFEVCLVLMRTGYSLLGCCTLSAIIQLTRCNIVPQHFQPSGHCNTGSQKT